MHRAFWEVKAAGVRVKSTTRCGDRFVVESEFELGADGVSEPSVAGFPKALDDTSFFLPLERA
jgi:hypothetical protein